MEKWSLIVYVGGNHIAKQEEATNHYYCTPQVYIATGCMVQAEVYSCTYIEIEFLEGIKVFEALLILPC